MGLDLPHYSNCVYIYASFLFTWIYIHYTFLPSQKKKCLTEERVATNEGHPSRFLTSPTTFCKHLPWRIVVCPTRLVFVHALVFWVHLDLFNHAYTYWYFSFKFDLIWVFNEIIWSVTYEQLESFTHLVLHLGLFVYSIFHVF